MEVPMCSDRSLACPPPIAAHALFMMNRSFFLAIPPFKREGKVEAVNIRQEMYDNSPTAQSWQGLPYPIRVGITPGTQSFLAVAAVPFRRSSVAVLGVAPDLTSRSRDELVPLCQCSRRSEESHPLYTVLTVPDIIFESQL